MSEFIGKLNSLSLKELRQLAQKYNLSQKIANVHKLKKNELIVHLLLNVDAVKKLYYDDLSINQIRAEKGLQPLKERKKPERKPKEQKQLNKDIDELIIEQDKLDEEARAEKDVDKKVIIMKKKKEIRKKLERLSPYIETDMEAVKAKAEKIRNKMEEEKKEEDSRLNNQTSVQKKYRLKSEIDQLSRTIKNLDKKEKETKDQEELNKIKTKKQSLLNELIKKDDEYKLLEPVKVEPVKVEPVKVEIKKKIQPKNKSEQETKIEPVKIDKKDKIIEMNDKLLNKIDEIIKISSGYTFQNKKEKFQQYFIDLLDEYIKNGTIDKIYSDNKYRDIILQIPQKLHDSRLNYDFYPTPLKCVKVFEDVIKSADNILEPTAGIGHIINELRKTNKKAKITAIEYNELFSEILKIFNPDVIINPVNKDYLYYNPDKIDYDLIVINPPFTYGGDSRYYINFLFQSLYLINRISDVYMPSIIFISPDIIDKKYANSFSLDDLLLPSNNIISNKKLMEIFKRYGLETNKKEFEYIRKLDDNIFKKEVDLEKAQDIKNYVDNLFGFYQGHKLGECEGFGGTKIKANIYGISGYGNHEPIKKVVYKSIY